MMSVLGPEQEPYSIVKATKANHTEEDNVIKLYRMSFSYYNQAGCFSLFGKED